MNTSIRTVTIIGAGPAGLLLAHYLLARGYQVAIYERRSDPRKISPDERRSFPISLQLRGQQALRGIPGLEAALAESGEMCQGTVIHRKQSARDIRRKQPIMAIDRNQIVVTLLDELETRYDASELQIAFDCACERIDDGAKTVTFQRLDSDGAGKQFTVSYERLVGADGANSQVRSQLAEHHNFTYERRYIPDAYKSIFLSRIDLETGAELVPNRIHSSTIGNDSRIILAPQPGNRLNGAFIFNEAHNPLEGLTTPEQILDYFEQELPTFRPLLSYEEAEALASRPVARLLTVKCDRFHQGDRILLIGDAIHAVSPSIGQGANAALQDVGIFIELLEQHEDSWKDVIAAFSEARLADAHALQALSDYSFPRTKPLIVEFFLRLLVTRKLHQWFPNIVSPFLFDQVLETDLNYSEILETHKGWINKVKQSMTAAGYSSS